MSALEKSGRLLARVEAVFSNLTSSDTNDALQAIELEMAPRLAAHWNAIYLNADLFARIDALYQNAQRWGWMRESLRVLERYHLDFVRAGAKLEGKTANGLTKSARSWPAWARRSRQNVLARRAGFVLPLERRPDGAGCRRSRAMRRRRRQRNAGWMRPLR